MRRGKFSWKLSIGTKVKWHFFSMLFIAVSYQLAHKVTFIDFTLSQQSEKTVLSTSPNLPNFPFGYSYSASQTKCKYIDSLISEVLLFATYSSIVPQIFQLCFRSFISSKFLASVVLWLRIKFRIIWLLKLEFESTKMKGSDTIGHGFHRLRPIMKWQPDSNDKKYWQALHTKVNCELRSGYTFCRVCGFERKSD